MQAAGGDSRFTVVVRRVRSALQAGPRWGANRAFTAGASAVIAVLAIVGIVALSTTGSPATPARDAAATTTTTPHYLLPIASLVQDGSVPAPTLAGDTGTVGVPAGTAPRPVTAPATGAPSVDTSGIATYRGATGTMTPAGIATLALERGCTVAQAPVATAVAMAESGGSPSAQGDVTLMTAVWDWSAGLWQIRGLRSERGTGGLRDSVANQGAVTNSAAMYVVSGGCSNWSPWTTYTRGLYLGYLGVATQAVNYVVAYYRAHGHYPAVAAPDPTAVIPVSTGAGQAAAAAQSSSSVPATRPTASAAKTAPTTPARPTSTTRASARPSTPAPTTSATPKAPSSATPTSGALPTRIVPTKILPSLPLPTSSLPTKILPTCVLGLPVLC